MIFDNDTLKNFIELIEKKTFKEFKDYVIDNTIELNKYKDTKGENVDILIKCIDNNAPSSVIEYIIINGQYETLNYKIYNKAIVFIPMKHIYVVDYYHGKNREDTPLASAIRNNNFELATVLMRYGAEINFIPCEIINEILNKKNARFLLENGYPMSENLIRETIFNKKWFIKQYYDYHVFDQNFILSFLMRYKNNTRVSTAQIKKEIKMEQNKIVYEDELVYYWPFKSDQYDILKLIYDHDSQPKETIHSIIYKLLSQHYEKDKTETFLKVIKNNDFDLCVDPNFTQQLEDLILHQHFYKRKIIEDLIERNDVVQLKNYVKTNHICLKDFNRKYDKYNDMLRSVIKYNGSIEMVKYILKECSYDHFSYNVISPDATDVVSLLYFTLSLSQYKTFNLLIEKGADIYYGDVMAYVTKKELIHPQHIKYFLDYNIELNKDILNKIIDENQLNLLKLILKRYSFNRSFVLELLSFYKGKTPISDHQWNTLITKEKDKQTFLCQNGYKSAKYNGKLNAINIIYENDPRDQDCIARKLFQLFGYEVSFKDSEIKNKFIFEIKKKRIKINVDSTYLTNLYYCEEKREKMKELITTNNLIELKKFITKNKIMLEYYSQPIFDLLIYAIEKLEDCDDTKEMILLLIHHYHSLNYSICDKQTGKYKSPFSCALSLNKFSFAKLLVEHGVKINENVHDTDILYKLYNEQTLTLDNLKFILKHNFNRISCTIIREWIKDFKNDFLNITFKHYLYDNDRILNFLSFYKNKKLLSSKQLEKIIHDEKSIITLNFEWFQEAITNKNNEALKILFHYFGNYSCMFNENISNLRKLISTAAEKNNQFFFEQLFSRKLFNFEKNITFEDLLQIIVKFNQFNLIKFIIEKSFHHNTFNVNIINIEKIIIYLVRVNNESIIDTFIDQLLNYNINNNILEDMILPLTKLNNNEITKARMDNILNHENFNFNSDLKINKIILMIPNIVDLSLRDYFIKKIILHPKLEFNIIVIEKILLALNKIKENDEFTISLIIETMKSTEKLNNDLLNHKKTDVMKILLSSIKHNNIFMTKYVLDEFVQSRNQKECIDFLEKPLLVSSNIENINAMNILLTKLFELLFLENKNNVNNNDIDKNDSIDLYINQNLFNLSSMENISKPYFSLILNILIKLKYYQQIKELIKNHDLKNNLNINCKDQNGEYPIIVVYNSSNYNDQSFELLKYFLNENVDYNVKDKNGNSLFMLAIKQKNYRVINELFKRNIPIEFDMNIINSSPIRQAIYNNQLDEVRTLIRFNRKSIVLKMKTIFNNNSNNNINTINSSNQSRNSYFTFLSLSYLLNHTKIFNYFLNGVDINEIDFNGYNILHFALLREDFDTIKKLLKLGININYYHKYLRYPSAIDIALHLNNKDIALLLINNKNLTASSLNTINEKGETPLITLLRLNNYDSENKIELMNGIFNKELNLNHNDSNGYSALDYAIKENSLKMVKLLINHGAILEKSLNKNNKEMLKYAISYNDIEIIEYFINSDISFFSNDIIQEIIYNNKLNIFKLLTPNYIDINRKDDANHTFLFYANEYKNNDIIKYLNEHGGNNE